MKNHSETMVCYRCHGVMRRGSQTERIEYLGEIVEYDQTSWFCDSCGESLSSGADIQLTVDVFAALRKRVHESSSDK